MSGRPIDVVLAMRCEFANYLREFYGCRAIVRRTKQRIVASSNPDVSTAHKSGGGLAPDAARPGRWKVFVDVYGDRLEVYLWPADESLTLETCDSTMWSVLDAALERGTRPLERWTLPAVWDLIRTNFVGRADIYRTGNETIIHPNGAYHRLLIVTNPDRIEIRHGPQNVARRDRIVVHVDLKGEYDVVRERLTAALRPLRRN